MNTTDYIILACGCAIVAATLFGYWSGIRSGRVQGWERCRWDMAMRQAARERARRDERTGRYRKIFHV